MNTHNYCGETKRFIPRRNRYLEIDRSKLLNPYAEKEVIDLSYKEKYFINVNRIKKFDNPYKEVNRSVEVNPYAKEEETL